MIPPLLLLIWPFLDRNPERHPKKRPFAVAVGIAALLLAIVFGVIGHFSESKVTWRGQLYHIDIYGVPHKAEAAPNHASESAESRTTGATGSQH